MLRGIGMALLLAVACCGAGSGVVKVERAGYHGWKGAYRLSNGTVDLIFVPQIGRIMRYGYIGGPNVLWENPALKGKTVRKAPAGDWINYGGDKLWPAPQGKAWPPDRALDGSVFSVTVLKGHRLRVVSPISRKLGIRFVRVIALDSTGMGVTLTNTMVNAGKRVVEWSVWEVAQVDDPVAAFLPLHTAGHFPDGYYVFKGGVSSLPESATVEGDAVRFVRHRKLSGKIGADSPKGWAYVVKKDLRFTVSAAYESGARYPDDGCAQEIYTNPDPLAYVELELLGPIRRLAPGAKQTLITHWKLGKSGL